MGGGCWYYLYYFSGGQVTEQIAMQHSNTLQGWYWEAEAGKAAESECVAGEGDTSHSEPWTWKLYKNATATELGCVQMDEDIAERLEDKEAKASKTTRRFLVLSWTCWRPEAEAGEALHSSSWPRLVAQCGQRKGECSGQPQRLDGLGNNQHPESILRNRCISDQRLMYLSFVWGSEYRR